jgi:multidrug efflux pump subunit AcrA (membrane-fusion protein)
MFEASGTVRGRNTAVLTSRIVAGLREVRVRAGDRVRTGQILAVLEDADAQAAVRRARADLAAAIEGRAESEQAVRVAEVNARVAGAAHARMTRLLAAQAVTQQAYEEAEGRQQSSSADRERAAAQSRGGAARIEEARAALSSAEAALAYTRIAAPFPGRVIDRRVDPGSQASPGTPLLVVEQEGTLRVEASVDESRASILTVGATAHVELESAGRQMEGRVTEVVPTIDPASRAFLVKIELPPARDPLVAALRPGMFARVRFPTGIEERLTVPAAALLPAGDLDRLFVVEGGRAHLRLVTLGQRDADRVEILSGLDPGEVVVTAPTPVLRDGAAVQARP